MEKQYIKLVLRPGTTHFEFSGEKMKITPAMFRKLMRSIESNIKKNVVVEKAAPKAKLKRGKA